jgi:hypothetical protein
MPFTAILIQFLQPVFCTQGSGSALTINPPVKLADIIAHGAPDLNRGDPDVSPEAVD